MIKRTLYFGNPSYLNTRDEQPSDLTLKRGKNIKYQPYAYHLKDKVVLNLDNSNL